MQNPGANPNNLQPLWLDFFPLPEPPEFPGRARHADVPPPEPEHDFLVLNPGIAAEAE